METIAQVIALGLLLWLTYSFVSTLLPFAPFRTRLSALASFGATLICCVAFGLVQAAPTTDAPQARQDPARTTPAPAPGKDEAIIKASALGSASIPAACGDGGLAIGDVVAVTGRHELRISADQGAARIKNEKASRILKSPKYHVIDNSTQVRRTCVQGDWTKIRITSPGWLTEVSGWAPSAALRVIERTETGQQLFTEPDFYWDKDTTTYKPQIITAVNRIAAENRKCTPVDPGSVAKSPSRSTPGDPVFFVTCGMGVDAFNVWFRPGDADGDASFTAKAPLDRTAAAESCERAAHAAATHPSTVSFSRLWDLAYLPHASGRARIVSSFTAQNGFNLKLKYRISCLFDGPTLIETQISEHT